MPSTFAFARKRARKPKETKPKVKRDSLEDERLETLCNKIEGTLAPLNINLNDATGDAVILALLKLMDQEYHEGYQAGVTHAIRHLIVSPAPVHQSNTGDLARGGRSNDNPTGIQSEGRSSPTKETQK